MIHTRLDSLAIATRAQAMRALRSWMHPTPVVFASNPSADHLSWMYPMARLGSHILPAQEPNTSQIPTRNMMAGTDPVETYRRIADVLRSAQRVAIEVEN